MIIVEVSVQLVRIRAILMVVSILGVLIGAVVAVAFSGLLGVYILGGTTLVALLLLMILASFTSG